MGGNYCFAKVSSYFSKLSKEICNFYDLSYVHLFENSTTKNISSSIITKSKSKLRLSFINSLPEKRDLLDKSEPPVPTRWRGSSRPPSWAPPSLNRRLIRGLRAVVRAAALAEHRRGSRVSLWSGGEPWPRSQATESGRFRLAIITLLALVFPPSVRGAP